MAVPTVAWSEATPPGAEAIATGDDRIREMKTQLREIIDVDHEHENAGSDTDWGMHKLIRLISEAGAAGADAVHGQLYQRPDGGAVNELFFQDVAANDLQITNDGALLIADDAIDSAQIADEAVTQAGFAQAATAQTVDADVYEDLDSMEVTITTVGGVGVLVDFVGCSTVNVEHQTGCYCIVEIDGATEATSEVWQRTVDINDAQQIHICFFVTGLAAAEHVFKIQWKQYEATYQGRMTNRMLRVVELKR